MAVGPALLKLIEDHNPPGATVRGLETAAELPDKFIRRCGEGGSNGQMPTMLTIQRVALAVHAPVEDVHQALCADLGYPAVGVQLTPLLRRLVAICRRIPEEAVKMIIVFAENYLNRQEEWT